MSKRIAPYRITGSISVIGPDGYVVELDDNELDDILIGIEQYVHQRWGKGPHYLYGGPVSIDLSVVES